VNRPEFAYRSPAGASQTGAVARRGASDCCCAADPGRVVQGLTGGDASCIDRKRFEVASEQFRIPRAIEALSVPGEKLAEIALHPHLACDVSELEHGSCALLSLWTSLQYRFGPRCAITLDHLAPTSARAATPSRGRHAVEAVRGAACRRAAAERAAAQDPASPRGSGRSACGLARPRARSQPRRATWRSRCGCRWRAAGRRSPIVPSGTSGEQCSSVAGT
jgi:hypothetical protein